MSYTILDRPPVRGLAIATGLIAMALVRTSCHAEREVAAPEIVVAVPESDLVDRIQISAADDRAPDRCLPIADIRVLRGHVTDAPPPIEYPAWLGSSRAMARLDLRPGHRFAVQFRPGELDKLQRSLEQRDDRWFEYSVHRRPAFRPVLCEGDVWINVERRHQYVCGNDRSPAYDWAVDVVIDTID